MNVRISSHFDGGNIRVINANDPAQVDLEIEADNNSDFLQWFYFRAMGPVQTLRILNAGKTSYPDGWSNYSVVASTDREEWFRVPTRYENGILTFEAPEDSQSTYFAYFAPYSYERHQDLVAGAMHHPDAKVSSLGLTLDGRELDLITVGEPGDEKKAIWIIARQHPGETMAEWFVEGFLDRLLDPDDPVAKALLAVATFYVVPNMNPDGAYRGNLRTNAAGANLNREWESPSMERSPEVYLVRQMMDETGVDLCLDVHGDEALPYNFISGSEGIPSDSERLTRLQEEFKSAYMRANPDFQVTYGYPTSAPGEANMTMATNQIAERYDCLAATIEQPFKDNANSPDLDYGWSPRRCQLLGASALDPIFHVIPTLRESN